MFGLFSITYGMSSFPLTNSIIFQDGYCTTNQPFIKRYMTIIVVSNPIKSSLNMFILQFDRFILVYNMPLQTHVNQRYPTSHHNSLILISLGWDDVIGDVFKYNDLGKL